MFLFLKDVTRLTCDRSYEYFIFINPIFKRHAYFIRISALEFVATPEEALNKASIELEERETTARAERRMLALLALENAIVSKDQDLDLKKKIGEKALEEVNTLYLDFIQLKRIFVLVSCLCCKLWAVVSLEHL